MTNFPPDAPDGPWSPGSAPPPPQSPPGAGQGPPPPAWGSPPGGQSGSYPPPGPGHPPGAGYPPGPGYAPGSGYPPGPGAAPGYGYGYGGYPQQVEHPQGTTVLVLGIVSIVVCQLTAPFAWIMGNKALREIDADPGRYSNRSSVAVGRIMGMIMTGVLVLVAIFIGFAIVLALVGSSTTDAEMRPLEDTVVLVSALGS